MKVTETKLEKLIPYARNPRKNGGAVDAVAGSIREFGFEGNEGNPCRLLEL